MPYYGCKIYIPSFIDKIIIAPVLILRWFWYGYVFRLVRLIPDKYAKVECVDFEKISKYTWWAKKTPRSYTAVRFEAKGRQLVPVYMHREIMINKLRSESAELPAELFVDHKNRDGLDNRRANLRPATASQNSMNRAKVRGTSSKYKGVSWNRSRKLWQGTIQVNKKNLLLGSFVSETEAARAYDEAAKKYQGEFAYLNFDDEGVQSRRAKLVGLIRMIGVRFQREENPP